MCTIFREPLSIPVDTDLLRLKALLALSIYYLKMYKYLPNRIIYII